MHLRSSSLHPSITKGSQQIGKQQSNNTANNTQPPVESFFFSEKGRPSWPQYGHLKDNELLLANKVRMLL
jgi:hypothetical protein